MGPNRWPPSKFVRLAWAARTNPFARGHLLQAFQAGADFDFPLTSSDLVKHPFAVPGECVAGILIRGLTDVKGAEAWLHTLLRAHVLRQVLLPTEIVAKRRF